jgi:hypothetical protein
MKPEAVLEGNGAFRYERKGLEEAAFGDSFRKDAVIMST